jgi:hypothetical protein
VYFARYEFFHDFGPLTGFELGISYLQGLNRRAAEIGGESFTIRGETRFWNIHGEFNYQPEVEYLYSGIQFNGEWFHQERTYFRSEGVDAAAGTAGLDRGRDETLDGWYLTAYYKLSRNWDTSIRFDRAPVLLLELGEEAAGAGGEAEEDEAELAGAYAIYGSEPIQAISLTLGYHTSRFTTLRAQYSRKTLDELDWNELWIGLQVLIGFERPDVF